MKARLVGVGHVVAGQHHQVRQVAGQAERLEHGGDRHDVAAGAGRLDARHEVPQRQRGVDLAVRDQLQHQGRGGGDDLAVLLDVEAVLGEGERAQDQQALVAEAAGRDRAAAQVGDAGDVGVGRHDQAPDGLGVGVDPRHRDVAAAQQHRAEEVVDGDVGLAAAQGELGRLLAGVGGADHVDAVQRVEAERLHRVDDPREGAGGLHRGVHARQGLGCRQRQRGGEEGDDETARGVHGRLPFSVPSGRTPRVDLVNVGCEASTPSPSRDMCPCVIGAPAPDDRLARLRPHPGGAQQRQGGRQRRHRRADRRLQPGRRHHRRRHRRGQLRGPDGARPGAGHRHRRPGRGRGRRRGRARRLRRRRAAPTTTR
jgi:hypothetical protein